MRIEWCKSRARASRWAEEVEMLIEEMRRIVVFLEWEAKCWDERSTMFSGAEARRAEGYHAYARRQATLRREISRQCCSSWHPTLTLAQSLGCSDGQLEETSETCSSHA